MGWTQKGRLVIPDGNPETAISKVDGEQVTPSGIVVPELPKLAEGPPPPMPKDIRKLIEKSTRQQKRRQVREANKKLLEDRFGYLRKPKPKNGIATSGK